MSAHRNPYEETARADGLAVGLAHALEGIDIQAAAPGGFAAVPAAWAGPEADLRRLRLADLEGVVFVRRDPLRAHDARAAALARRRLAHVRLGLARRLLDRATEHLGARTAGEEPLIRKQMVIATVADVMTGLELLHHQAVVADDGTGLADVHLLLDELGWEIARLFGAFGYIADDEAARSLYVSALVANTWVATSEHERDEREEGEADG
ncbi:acyl-CoA dehydrogenase [Streptomyces parvus]|uniref:acyl-CoA dehydrogenase n=1 Tax=Streptomyces parvus TaxID=66428 RepID=UPI0033F228DD